MAQTRGGQGLGLFVNVWDIDLPEIKVNPSQPQKIANRQKCRDVRLALGRIVTREDFEKERTRILSKPLP
jgi:hypothetical protein